MDIDDLIDEQTASDVLNDLSTVTSTPMRTAAATPSENSQFDILLFQSPTSGDFSLGLSDMDEDLSIDKSDASNTTVVEFPNTLTKSQRKRLNRKNKSNEGKINGGSDVAGSTSTDPKSVPSSSTSVGGESKRPRSSGETPPNVQPRGKRIKSFAEVVQKEVYLRLGVGDGLEAGLNNENVQLLNALIHNEIVAMVEGGAFIPIMRGHSLHGNLVVYSCANEETYNWLKSHIKLINANWKGSKLYVVDNPEFTKVKVWLPGPMEEPKRVFGLLQKLNVGLNTGYWRLASQIKHEGKGQLLFIFVDPEALEFLKKCNMRLQYVLNRIAFKVAGDKPSGVKPSGVESAAGLASSS